MPSRVSEPEKLVMEVLWHESPLSSGEVVKRLRQHDWNEKTVKTFLNRLVKKSVVSFEKMAGGTYIRQFSNAMTFYCLKGKAF
jgi:BlaI family penicillinase repressor